MNIGLFTDTYFPQVSGVSTSIKSLRDELMRQGHQVIIFTTTDPDAPKETEPGIVRLPSIPFVAFEDRRIAYSGFEKALKLARFYKLDIIHTHTEFSLGLAGLFVASRMKLPVIHTYHTLYEKYTHYILDGDLIQAKHVGALSKLFCNQVDGVITPSAMTETTLRSYGVKTPIRIIPTGVKIPGYDQESVNQLKNELAIKDDEIVFLSLSRLSREKSIDKVIEAYANMESNFPKSRLLIVGGGPAQEELESQAKQTGANIQFVGEVTHDQVARYYQLCHLYLNASESETQGLTYLEAFANRLPIVAKRNPYLESLMPDQRFGALFDDQHPLASTANDFMVAMLSGQIDQIDQSALSLISVEMFANRVMDYYQAALSSHKKSRFNVPDIIVPRIKGLIRDVVLGPQNPHS